MNDMKTACVHWSFWAIGTFALFWNGMGVLNYFMQMDPASLSSFPESHRAIIENRPAWATGAFAIAVFGGVIGCLLLLLKKSAAIYLFIASLLGTIVVTTHALGMTSHFRLFEITLMIILPVVVSIFMIWYAKWSISKGWIS